MNDEKYIWKARMRNRFGLPWTFTVYRLTEEKLFVTSGVFNKTHEEVRLYRVIDMTLKCSFVQRIFGLGTIHFCTRDRSTPEFDVKNIKKPMQVKELLSTTVEECRVKNGISVKELMGNSFDDEEDETHI